MTCFGHVLYWRASTGEPAQFVGKGLQKSRRRSFTQSRVEMEQVFSSD